MRFDELESFLTSLYMDYKFLFTHFDVKASLVHKTNSRSREFDTKIYSCITDLADVQDERPFLHKCTPIPRAFFILSPLSFPWLFHFSSSHSRKIRLSLFLSLSFSYISLGSKTPSANSLARTVKLLFYDQSSKRHLHVVSFATSDVPSLFSFS